MAFFLRFIGRIILRGRITVWHWLNLVADNHRMRLSLPAEILCIVGKKQCQGEVTAAGLLARRAGMLRRRPQIEDRRSSRQMRESKTRTEIFSRFREQTYRD